MSLNRAMEAWGGMVYKCRIHMSRREIGDPFNIVAKPTAFVAEVTKSMKGKRFSDEVKLRRILSRRRFDFYTSTDVLMNFLEKLDEESIEPQYFWGVKISPLDFRVAMRSVRLDTARLKIGALPRTNAPLLVSGGDFLIGLSPKSGVDGAMPYTVIEEDVPDAESRVIGIC